MKVSLLVVSILLSAAVALAGCTAPAPESSPDTADMEAVADQLAASINAGLGDLRDGIYNNSRTLASSGLSGRVAEEALAENLLHHPWAISSLVISRDGMVLTAVPANYAGMVGMNLSWQPEVQKANTDRVPIVSGVFRMEEGFDGISQSVPVYSPGGEYLGYTDITYRADAFLGRQVGTIISRTPYDVWIAQKDGRVIYDSHQEEIGTNILSDPAYSDPALREIFIRIAGERSGSGTYSFHDENWNGTVTKTAVWVTAGTDGAEWRVVVTRSADGDGVKTSVTPAPQATDARYANLTRFVERAAAYAREHGKEVALRDFNNPNGTFIEGELYIFAYGMNGTAIALPYQQGLLGTDRRGISDSNGVEFIDGLAGIARDGGGSLYYLYPNPEHGYREEFKLAYVLPVDDDWFLGSGIYLPGLGAGFTTTERDELMERVKEARRYAQAHGAGRAIADFNDPAGVFANGSRYIFAYAFNGTTLALPYQPELIGSNRLDFADPYGVKILAWEVATAQRGGGFVYVDYTDPETGMAGLKLCYVAPVDDDWFVGSGIYAGIL
ncbi:MAG TPA: cache domain-containing protein [Methanoregula sp.]|nr:cache domain-containing protein [Methanoregula sp.]